MQLPIKSSQIIIILGVFVVIGAIAFSFFQVFRATPPKNPEEPGILREPKTIGVILFRQQEEVVNGLKEGLKELGYSNITYKEIMMPVGDRMAEEASEHTKELLAEGVDLVYTGLEFQALSAITTMKEMGNDTPIVFMAQFHDPIAYGLAKSFRSSENNATGVSLNIIQVVQKELEFLKKIKPSVKKIGVFSDGFMVPPLSEEFYPELRRQAAKFGYEIVAYTTKVPPPEAEAAFHATAAAIKPGDIDAIYHLAGHYFSPQEAAESELASRLKIPMIAPLEDLPNGGHFGYSGDYTSAGKQTAKMVDKIFRGAKPRDIPLEYVEKLPLVIYLTRARLAGVEFPESILEIADTIVK